MRCTPKGHSLLSILVDHPSIQRKLYNMVSFDWNDPTKEPTIDGFGTYQDGMDPLVELPAHILAMVKVLAPGDYRLRRCVWSVLEAGHLQLFKFFMEECRVPFSIRHRKTRESLYQFAANNTECYQLLEYVFQGKPLGNDHENEEFVNQCFRAALQKKNPVSLLFLSQRCRTAPDPLYRQKALHRLCRNCCESALYAWVWRVLQDVNATEPVVSASCVRKQVCYLIEKFDSPDDAPFVLDVLQALIRCGVFKPNSLVFNDHGVFPNTAAFAQAHGTQMMAALMSSLLKARCIER